MITNNKSELYEKHLRNIDPKEYEKQKAREADMENMRYKVYDLISRNLNWSNKYQEEVKVYLKWFMGELETFSDVATKLRFVIKTENELFKLRQEALVDLDHFNKRHYQNLLDIIEPWKTQLRNSLLLEKELAEYTPPKKIDQLEPAPELMQTAIPLKEIEPIKVPVDLTNSMPLNEPNIEKPKQIETFRKFDWSDTRIPELLTDFFCAQKCIFEEDKKLMLVFLRTGHSTAHIRWRKKGNLLTTAFFDLKRKGYLQIRQDYLAERIEKNIFSSSDTLKPIGTKGTIIASFSPGPKSVKKRAHQDDPDYLDVITYLKNKLQTPA